MASIESKIIQLLVRPGRDIIFNDFIEPRYKRLFVEFVTGGFASLFAEREAVIADSVPAEFIGNPKSERVILYFHGGGYVFGSVNSHRPLIEFLAGAGDLRILAVNYRLAPEYKYPAALEDALASYGYLLKSGYRPEQIGVAGDSAGGGLSLALAMKLRDMNKPLRGALALFSPWVDVTASGDSVKERAHRDTMLAASSENYFSHCYAHPDQWRTPYVSPLFGDLKQIPPMLIHVGTEEILFSDAERLAEKAEKSELDVTYKIWEEQGHVFQLFCDYIPEARVALCETADFFNEKLK